MYRYRYRYVYRMCQHHSYSVYKCKRKKEETLKNDRIIINKYEYTITNRKKITKRS